MRTLTYAKRAPSLLPKRRGRGLAFAGAVVAVVTVLSTSRAAHATEVGGSRRAGVGFAIGDPTGIVGKLFLNAENALDAGLSFWSAYGRCRRDGRWDYCGGYSSFSVNIDYLWQMNLVRSTAKLDWHVGIGGRAWFYSADNRDSDFALGARVPFGLDLTFQNPSFLEVFFEISPIVYIVPGAGFGIEPVLGVRFYF